MNSVPFTGWILAGALAIGCGTPATDPFDDGPGTNPPGSHDGGPSVDEPPAQAEGASANLPRLTTTQYRRSLEALFGRGLPQPPLEADTNPFFFDRIGAASTTVSEIGVEQYEQAAAEVTAAVFADPAWAVELVGCVPTKVGDTCTATFLRDFGRRAFRRQLSLDEQVQWHGVATRHADGDPWLGIQAAVTAMLQSPWFLYRVETGQPDPDDTTRWIYTDDEMASRLAFLLWNAPPDDELLDAAARGELSDAEGIETQARRMLADPRAREAVADFFGQLYDVSALDGVTRDPVLYPDFTPELAASMAQEIRLLAGDIVFRRHGDIRTILNTRRTFVDSRLAELYGVEAPGASTIAYTLVELPEGGHRAGLLTTGGILTMNAHEAQTSPTLRGKFLRERVLCDEIPPPPPEVATELAEGGEGLQTLRDQLAAHRENPSCAACHDLIDPPGFLFESFDAMGQFRTVDDQGLDIDATGDLDGTPIASARALADLLATDDRVGPCMVKHLYRHAQSRLEAPAEEPTLWELSKAFARSGHRFDELLVALATHESFRTLAPPEEVAP